jgi:7-cyano-7-deazaguanine synthase in queuosine biosynthesis
MYKLAKTIKLDPICVFFDLGQPYLHKELQSLPSFVHVRKVDWLESGELLSGKTNTSGNIYIPGRNLTLASLAASIYMPSHIWLGALLGEIHAKATDKNLEFLSKVNQLFKYVFSPFSDNVELQFPLVDLGLSKLTAVKWAINNGSTPSELHSTSSCLSELDGKCGTCVVCVRRWGIFGQLGIPEDFVTDPLTNTQSLGLILELLKENSYYDMHRKDEVLPYVRLLFPGLDDISISNTLLEVQNTLY